MVFLLTALQAITIILEEAGLILPGNFAPTIDKTAVAGWEVVFILIHKGVELFIPSDSEVVMTAYNEAGIRKLIAYDRWLKWEESSK